MPLIMPAELNQKNDFVIALMENLKSKYITKYYYVAGKRENSNEPKDIIGFTFRKDLCSYPPQNKTNILIDVYNFASGDKNLESILREDTQDLTIKFGDKKYLVNSHIGGGYAGEINIHFMELFVFGNTNI